MDREEVTKWLSIMKANLNSFPEVSNAKKIEALAEAIRLLKNEQSIDKIDCEHTECMNCTNHKYCDYEISSSENPNKSENPTSSDDCISREQAIKKEDNLTLETGYDNEKVEEMLKELTSITPTRMLKELPSITPIRPKGHWINHSDEGYVECPKCGSATNCDSNINDLHFCFSCGAEMGVKE